VSRLHPVMVVVSRGLQWLELFWCRRPGLPLASTASQYMVREHGTGCRLLFDHQDLAFTHSSVSWRLICFSTNPVLAAAASYATVRLRCDFLAILAPFINIQTELNWTSNKISIQSDRLSVAHSQLIYCHVYRCVTLHQDWNDTCILREYDNRQDHKAANSEERATVLISCGCDLPWFRVESFRWHT